MILGIVALFTVILCLVALREPAWGLGLAAAADLILMEGVPVGGTTVAVESFFFLYLLCIPLLAQLLGRGNVAEPLARARPLLVFVLAFYGVCVVSAVLGGMSGGSPMIVSRLPLWTLFGLSSIWLCRSERDLVVVAKCVVAPCQLQLLMAVATGQPSAAEQGGLMRHRYLNPLGHGLSLGAVLAFALYGSRAVRGTRRVMALGLVGLFLVGILWTGSRGSLISAAFSLSMVAWVVSPGRTKSAFKLATLAGSLLLVFAVGSGHVGAAWERFLANDASSNLYRFQIAILSGRLFVSEPLFGVGLGGMESAGIFLSSDLRTLATTIISSDNDYARILAELGAVGSLVVLSWVVYVKCRYREAILGLRMAGRRQTPAVALGVGVASNLVVLGMFESVLFSPTGWFYLGFTWACIRLVPRLGHRVSPMGLRRPRFLPRLRPGRGRIVG